MGNDVLEEEGGDGQKRFQSTFPVWGTTPLVIGHGDQMAISIHVPRMGNDVCRGLGLRRG